MLKNDQEVATETGSQPSPWYLTDEENRLLFYLPAQGPLSYAPGFLGS